MIPAMAKKGWVDLHLLRLDGKAIAYELCFDFNNRLFAYNASYDRAFRQFSPGTIVSAAVVEAACARGRTEYDMLRGNDEYKSHWSDSFRVESQVLVPAKRLRSALYSALGLYLKNRLKSMKWVEQLDDRLSGLVNRLRYRT